MSLHKFQQTFFVARLRGCCNRLTHLKIILGICVATAFLTTTNQADAQIPLPGLGTTTLGPFTLADRAKNPLRPAIYRDYHNKPTAVDLDKDGDPDIVLGSYYGAYRYFRNDGTAANPAYTELIDDKNPLYYVEGWSAPTFADLDSDGDLDMFVGEDDNDSDSPIYGSIHYFVNENGKFWTEPTPGNFEANEQKGTWNPAMKAGNPVHLLIYDTHVMPTFVDLDKDGDLDLIISSDFDAEPTAVTYYVNNNGNFTLTDFHPYTTWFNEDLNFGDVDEDGDVDMVIGDIDGDIHFFANNGSGTFAQQTGPWNATTRTGNPFNGLTPADMTSGNNETSLALHDFTGDGKIDAMVGFLHPSYPSPYEYERPYVLRNTGRGVMEMVSGLVDPLDGVRTDGIASVDFQDVNNDGHFDAVISGMDDSGVTLFVGGSAGFSQASAAANPFNSSHLGSFSPGASGQLVDFDKDGDFDFVVITGYGEIRYYKNINGNYVLMPASDPSNPFNIPDLNYYGSNDELAMLAFADIDADNDVDVFVGTIQGYVDFYRNDNGTLVKRGSRDSNYLPTDNLNPLGAILTPQPYYGGGNLAIIRFVDLDHDGDFDAFVGFSSVALDSDGFIVEPNSLTFYENIGTSAAPVFSKKASPFSNDDLEHSPGVKFFDFDKDGDLDGFVGIQEDDGAGTVGHFRYFINTNPAPVVSAAATVPYQPGSGSVVLDANINLTDQDNDVMTQATIAIQNFEAGKESLAFTPKAPVSGSYNATTGMLTLSGRGTVADYVAVLKTITYQYTGQKPASGGRKPSSGSKTFVVNRDISLLAFDTDFTTGTPKVMTVQVTFPNVTPAIATSGTTAKYLNAAVIVDNGVTITDADDAAMAGATIKFDPTKIAGPEDLLEFSSQNGINGAFVAATGTLTLTGTSSTANYQAALRSITYKNSATGPTQGSRVVQFSVFDGENNSNVATTTVSVEGNIVVYNALSPNGDNLNSVFLIQNIDVLEPANKVAIFDRWGAKVYDAQNYNNKSVAFTGHSSSGGELPTGVYFYRIEFLGTSGRDALEGFLAIRR